MKLVLFDRPVPVKIKDYLLIAVSLACPHILRSFIPSEAVDKRNDFAKFLPNGKSIVAVEICFYFHSPFKFRNFRHSTNLLIGSF